MTIFPMAVTESGGEASAKSWWLYLLLGIVMVVAGTFVLGHVVLASVISAIFIGWVILIAGVLEIVHAFGARGWKGFLLDLLLGVLYIVGGWMLVSNPLAASISITLAIGVIWIVSGIFRLALAGALGRESGWAIFFSGLLGILAGGIILVGWPATGLWVLGLLLGIDLIFYGFAWMGYAFGVRSRGAAATATA